MIASAVAFGIVALAAGTPGPQLLVIDIASERPADCKQAPAGWDNRAATDVAAPALVAKDLERYFGGLSAQFTSVLEAAWKGEVWLCSSADETTVLRTLTRAVLRPDRGTAHDPSEGLPNGADSLLRAFAGPALVSEIEAFQPADSAERARQRLALEIVRSASPPASQRSVTPATP